MDVTRQMLILVRPLAWGQLFACAPRVRDTFPGLSPLLGANQ